jgi:hypothetical protein
MRKIAQDEATRNFVSWQAQEAILNLKLPAIYKDGVVEAAVQTIRKIGERRDKYKAQLDDIQAKKDARNAKERDRWRLKKSHTIYKAK